MPSAVLLALALAALGGAPARSQEDVALHLAELGSPVAADRARAERWLAAHLEARDAADVARAAAGGDAEVRGRLSAAVGAEERSFALAVALAGSSMSAAAEVGRSALGELAARFCPALDEPPLTGRELTEALGALGQESRMRLLQTDIGASPAETLQELARSGEALVPIVLDPAARQRADRRVAGEELSYLATWDALCVTVAAANGLRLAGLGLDADGGSRGGAFLRLALQGGEGQGTARELLVGWALPGDEAGRGRRLASLLETGWPAARAWIEGLAAAGDETARDALIGAAAAGVWPAAWNDRAAVAVLLARLRQAGTVGDRAAAERVALALSEAPARLADGSRVAELIGAAWDELSSDAWDPAKRDAERALLCVALEGLGAPDAESEARLRALLAAPPAGPSATLLRQALRACVACADYGGAERAPLELGAPLILLGPREGWSGAAYRELGALLAASGARPAATLLDPAALTAGGLPPTLPEARSALVAWFAAAGEVDAAARLLLATPGHASVFAELFENRARAGDGLEARAVLERARALAADDAARDGVDRVAAQSGLIDAQRRQSLLARVPELGPRDADLLAALAGAPEAEAEPARTALLNLLQRTLEADATLEGVLPITEAVERALGDLLSKGADKVADGLRDGARERIQAGKGGAARARLAAARWPPMPPALDTRDLSLERRP